MNDRRTHPSGDLRFVLVAVVVWRVAQAAVLQAFGGASALRQISGLRPLDHPGVFLWDAAWYQRILVFGYEPIHGGTQQSVHFFPLLPWVTKAVQLVVRSEVAAALIVTNLAALAAVLLVFKVIATWKNRRVARYAVVLMLAFPSSLFLWQFYTEGLFIALVAGALLAQLKDRMWLAGLLAAGATMTRPPGFLVVVVLAIGVLEKHRSLHRDLAPAAVGLLGLVPVTIAQWIQAGSPLAYVSSQAAWGHRLGTPWKALTNSLRAYLYGGRPGLDGWAWSSISILGSPRDLVASYLFLALTIIAFFRNWPWTARALLLVMTLFPLVGGVPLSMSRYVLAAWPGFAVLSDLVDRAPRVLRIALIAGLAVISVLVLHDFSRGFFVG